MIPTSTSYTSFVNFFKTFFTSIFKRFTWKFNATGFNILSTWFALIIIKIKSIKTGNSIIGLNTKTFFYSYMITLSTKIINQNIVFFTFIYLNVIFFRIIINTFSSIFGTFQTFYSISSYFVKSH